MSQQPCYYRLSPSPPPQNAPYGTFDHNTFSPAHTHSSATSAGYECCGPDSDSPVTYSPSSPSNSAPGYASCGDPGPSMSRSAHGLYQLVDANQGKRFTRPTITGPSGPSDVYHIYDDFQSNMPCTCLANPATGPFFIRLAQQLQGTVNLLQHMPEHAQSSGCDVYKRIYALNDILQCVSAFSLHANSDLVYSLPQRRGSSKTCFPL